jgi:hypothetical protein
MRSGERACHEKCCDGREALPLDVCGAVGIAGPGGEWGFITEMMKAMSRGNVLLITIPLLLCVARPANQWKVMNPFIAGVMNPLIRGYSHRPDRQASEQAFYRSEQKSRHFWGDEGSDERFDETQPSWWSAWTPPRPTRLQTHGRPSTLRPHQESYVIA